MTTVFGRRAGGATQAVVAQQVAEEVGTSHSSWSRTLRNPGPATSGLPAIGARSTASATACGDLARVRASPALAMAMQPLAW